MELSNAVGDFAIEPQNAAAGDIFAVREALTALTLMLTPFAPHVAEEFYSILVGNEDGLIENNARFPGLDAELAKADEIELPDPDQRQAAFTYRGSTRNARRGIGTTGLRRRED